jgi:hypothetical protein
VTLRGLVIANGKLEQMSNEAVQVGEALAAS